MSSRSSLVSPSKQSILARINESVRTPTQDSRPTPINPSADMAARVRESVSLNASVKEESRKQTPSIAMVAVTPPVPLEDEVMEKSTRSSVSLPPISSPNRLAASKSVTLSPHLHDSFTKREIELVNELNVFRRSPQMYAQKMSLFMELHEPFVSHKRMTFPELQQFVIDKTEEKLGLEKQLDEMGSKERDEKASLQARWAAEDIERAKKNKKAALGAANKKRGSAVTDEQESISLERNSILNEITQRYESARLQASASLQRVQIELHKASHGVKFVSICLKKVGASPPLEELTYGRGLSLGARDACELGSAALTQVATLARKYGSGASYGIAQFAGEESVQQTIMEILLCRNDPTFGGRQTLLEPTFNNVGCGWRTSSTGVTHTTFLLSRLFENLQAISNRSNIPLSQLKHELPNAVKETPGTAIGIHSTMSIEIVEPKHHPHKCGNVARMLFRCPDGLQLCGVVTHIAEPEPKGPVQGDGRSFAHRIDESTVELLSVMPHRGDFLVTLFASNASFSSGYNKIGKIKIASYDWKPIESAITLPVATGDFAKRNSRLVSPMNGVLAPLSLQTFEVVIPFSKYLQDELSIIESELAAIESKNHRSGTSLEELEAAAAAAQKNLTEVEIQSSKQIQALDEGLLSLSKEAARKRGKELKSKNAQAELEEQRRSEEQQIAAAQKALLEATARVDSFRRSARQISAQQKRLNSEKDNLQRAMDRSSALLVELSVGERRAVMNPVPSSNGTDYTLKLRVPKEGNVCLYVNGLLQLTWRIGDV